MPGEKRAKSDDGQTFDADAQLKLQTAHEAVERPDKFAELFCKAAKTQTAIKDILWDELRKLLASDQAARESLKGIIREVEKEDWKFLGKKFFIGIWTLVVIVLTSIANALFGGFFSG